MGGLHTSPEHPFFVRGVGFVPASLLAVGNAIVTRAGPPLTVAAVQTKTQPGGYTVYNFVVPGQHTYFVGTLDGGAWVHNPADCSEVVERFGSESEATGAARTGTLSAKPGHEGNPKWIAEVGRITKPRGLGSTGNYTHRMEIHVTGGTKEWLQQFQDKPDNEPGRYAIPADRLGEFNARVTSIRSTRFRTSGRQMKSRSGR